MKRNKKVERNDKHGLRLNYFSGPIDDPEDYDIEIIHPQSCKIWFGCTLSKEERDGRAWGYLSGGDCPMYHHAHWRFDCALGYLEENIGTKDALGLDWYTLSRGGKDPWLVETIERLLLNIGRIQQIEYEFSAGRDYWGEYDEEFSWSFT